MDKTCTTLTCDCGSFRATLSDIDPVEGVHLRCHCPDCRAFVRVLVPDAVLRNGLHLYQTDPGKIEVDTGADNLQCMTLSPNGLLRWYADCCKTPMFNTPRSAKVPLVAVVTEIAEDPSVFGPVISDSFLKTPDGKTKTTGLAKVIFRFIRRSLSSKFSGSWKDTPFFFIPENIPVEKPYVISKSEKRAAYKA